jgi:hypothetical protein
MKPGEPVVGPLEVPHRPPPLPLVQRLIVGPPNVVIAHVPSPPRGEPRRRRPP